MRKFWGLLKREYMLNGANAYIILAIVILSLIFIPVGFEQYNAIYNADEVRLVVILGCAIGIVANAIFMPIVSINRDIKIKELWLHNSNSIYKLIGVKVLFQFVAMAVISIVNFIGFFFVGDLIEGTVAQFILLAVFNLFIIFAVFIFFVVLTILYNSFLRQLVAWIGKLGYIVGFAIIIFTIYLLDYVPSMSFLQIGHVNVSNLNEYLPTFNGSIILFDAIIDFYIVEEIVLLGVLALLFAVSCKWLERVITR